MIFVLLGIVDAAAAAAIPAEQAPGLQQSQYLSQSTIGILLIYLFQIAGLVCERRSKARARKAGQALLPGQSRHQRLVLEGVDLEDITTVNLKSLLPEEGLDVSVKTEGGEPRLDYGLEEDITTGHFESLLTEEGLDVLAKAEEGDPRPDSTALPDFYLF
ncbi:hypothetical protein MY11210_007872 [Beauveria gryllotalpidicola]